MFRSDITGYDPRTARLRFPPLIIVAAALAAKKGIEAVQKNKAAKLDAKNNKAASDAQTTNAQRDLNRSATARASLKSRLHAYHQAQAKAGVADSADAYNPELDDAFVKDHAYNADDYTLEAMPLQQTRSTLGVAAEGAGMGAADAVAQYYSQPGAGQASAGSAIQQRLNQYRNPSGPPAYDDGSGSDPNPYYTGRR